jgi:predicted lipoprotein with Yx(FWY)xxD motif
MKAICTRWNARNAAVALTIASAVLLAACSSSPSSTAGTTPKPTHGLTLYAYKTSLGTAVGSIAGIVAYTDSAESSKHFVCTSSSCTATWHPWVTDGVTVKAAAGVQQSLIGSVKRPDGSEQMTYNGHPLYLYAHTQHAVQANAEGAGGVWYVVGTDGNVIK